MVCTIVYLSIYLLRDIIVVVVGLSRFSRVQLFVTLWTVAYRAPLSMGFFPQEYCSALPFPPPGDLPDPGIKPTSLASPALAGRFFPAGRRGRLQTAQHGLREAERTPAIQSRRELHWEPTAHLSGVYCPLSFCTKPSCFLMGRWGEQGGGFFVLHFILKDRDTQLELPC